MLNGGRVRWEKITTKCCDVPTLYSAIFIVLPLNQHLGSVELQYAYKACVSVCIAASYSCYFLDVHSQLSPFLILYPTKLVRFIRPH